jgi:hypothetical protein
MAAVQTKPVKKPKHVSKKPIKVKAKATGSKKKKKSKGKGSK